MFFQRSHNTSDRLAFLLKTISIFELGVLGVVPVMLITYDFRESSKGLSWNSVSGRRSGMSQIPW